MEVMAQYLEDFWDERNWQVALKLDDPYKAYNEAKSEQKSLANATPINELPEHEKSWLRAT